MKNFHSFHRISLPPAAEHPRRRSCRLRTAKLTAHVGQVWTSFEVSMRTRSETWDDLEPRDVMVDWKDSVLRTNHATHGTRTQ